MLQMSTLQLAMWLAEPPTNMVKYAEHTCCLGAGTQAAVSQTHQPVSHHGRGCHLRWPWWHLYTIVDPLIGAVKVARVTLQLSTNGDRLLTMEL